MSVERLFRVSITVADLDAAVVFYRDGLGLQVGPDQALGDPAWATLLGLDAGTAARAASVAVGAEEIKLVAFDPPGAPYPEPRASNDQWFEHVALVARDIDAVWKRLEAAKPETITKGGPVTLPPNTGSVSAFKFRDPEGHPLELISFPDGVGDPRWQQGGSGICGYDHTAIAVTDLDRSLAFYTDLLGFKVSGRSLNQGPGQDQLDGLSDCLVDVVALQPTAAPTPHVELLHYRTPRGRTSPPPAANDIGSVRQVHQVRDLDAMLATLKRGGATFVADGAIPLKSGRRAASVRDPDSHLIVLIA